MPAAPGPPHEGGGAVSGRGGDLKGEIGKLDKFKVFTLYICMSNGIIVLKK